MQISRLRLKNFRNFDDIDISTFSNGMNLLCGPNGSGKTDILESIGLASLAKSCRGALDSEMVKLGARVATVEIEGIVEKKGKY